MKSTIRLNKEHELILQLMDSGKQFKGFTLKDLENAVNLMKSVNYYDFIRTMRVATGKELDFVFRPYGSRDLSEFEKIIYGLEFAGLIIVSGKLDSLNCIVFLTDEGEQVVERLREGRRIIIKPDISQRSTLFIASAFGHEDTDSLYANCFVPACEGLGYKPHRVDLTEPSETITSLIMEGITEAACVIADLTYARPFVYFEVGYAHGLGIPLLLTCRKDHFHGKEDSGRVHFDLVQYKISYWHKNAKDKFSWQKSMSPSERLSTILKPYKKTVE